MQFHNVILADPATDTRQALAAAINQTPNLTVVGQTHDGQELLRVCGQIRCDVVVMDLILSTLDGLEVLDRLRALPVKPVVLVLSGFAANRVAELSVSHGADYLMLKPCQPEAVVRRIQQISRRAPGPDAIAAGILNNLGIPSKSRGCQYLRDAVVMASRDRGVLDGITKILYPRIAKKHHTSACGVERSIRHAIEIAWERSDPQALAQYFGPCAHRKRPTNSEFIAVLSDRLRIYLLPLPPPDP